jgi:type VI protein secretion system component Hcp
MSIFVRFSAKGLGLPGSESRIYSLAHGSVTITPRNFRQAGVGLAAATLHNLNRRDPQPLILLKEADAASSRLFAALAGGKALPALTIEFLQGNLKNIAQLLATLTLVETMLQGHLRRPPPIKFPLPGPGSGSLTTSEAEEFQLTFRQIEFTWNGGQSSSDNWDS